VNAPLGEAQSVNAPPGVPPHAASGLQQLPVPVLAEPPFGALHFALALLMLHLTLPLAVTRQHFTLLVPQVDLAAHLVALPLHALSAAGIAPFAHCT
jgi:hypothetical protein